MINKNEWRHYVMRKVRNKQNMVIIDESADVKWDEAIVIVELDEPDDYIFQDGSVFIAEKIKKKLKKQTAKKLPKFIYTCVLLFGMFVCTPFTEVPDTIGEYFNSHWLASRNIQIEIKNYKIYPHKFSYATFNLDWVMQYTYIEDFV